jgi:hypothetical protein
VVRHGVAEATRRQFPVGTVLGQTFGHRHRTPHGVVDGRGSGQEGIALGATRGVERPADRAIGLLPAKDEVDPSLDGGPQLAQELHITGDQVMVPGPCGQVGAHVGVQPLILYPRTLVVVEPASVGQLTVGQPAVGRHRLAW